MSVPAPRQIITRENIEACRDPYRIVVLMYLPGEPATCRIFFPGDIGGVDAAKISS